MHGTCEFCGSLLDGESLFDEEETNYPTDLGANVFVSYTLCNECGKVNEIVDYSKELVSAH